MDFARLHLHWSSKKNGGKEYKPYSLARYIRVEGKVRKEIVLRLGKLSEEQIAQWRHILYTFKNPAKPQEAPISKVPENEAPKQEFQELVRSTSKKTIRV